MLKVWGGRIYGSLAGFHGARCLVAESSLRKAVELLRKAGQRETIGVLRDYWSKTHNALELQTATEPGVWINVGTDAQQIYKRVL